MLRPRESCSIRCVFISFVHTTHLSTTIHHAGRKRERSNRKGDEERCPEKGERERERKGNGWITTIGESVWLMIGYNAIFIKLISLQPVYNARPTYGLAYIRAPFASFSPLPLASSWLWRLYDPRPSRSRMPSDEWIQPLLRAVVLAPFIINETATFRALL